MLMWISLRESWIVPLWNAIDLSIFLAFEKAQSSAEVEFHGHLWSLWHWQFLIHMRGSTVLLPSTQENSTVIVLVLPGPQHFSLLHVEQYLGLYSVTLSQSPWISLVGWVGFHVDLHWVPICKQKGPLHYLFTFLVLSAASKISLSAFL